MSLLPYRPPVEQSDVEPEVIEFGEATDKFFTALRSATARAILSAVCEHPAAASDLADCLDSSLQNVNYHLNNLQESGLVRVVDTWYSEKGREMKVYGPESNPMMVVVGPLTQGEMVAETLPEPE